MATDINITPSADMPPVTTSTSGATATAGTSGTAPSEEARAALALEQEAIKSKAAAQNAAGEQIPLVEGAKAAAQDAAGATLTTQADEAAKVRENYLQRIEYASTQAARARTQYENYQFHNYWDNKSTGDAIQSVVAGAFGGFSSGINGGPNYALVQLQDRINRDFDRQKLQLQRIERTAEWKDKGVTDLYGQMQHDLAALEVKHGLALRAVAAKAQAQLIRTGIPAQQAANDVTVQGFMADAAAKDLAAKQRYEQHYDRQTQKNSSEQVTSAKGGKPEHGDVKEVADADSALANIDKMVAQIKENPAAWQEYRDNAEHWQRMEKAKDSSVVNPVRVAGQVAGAANIAPEQGLKTDAGRTLHQRQEALNTGIAKGFGGVITEGDRAAAASQQGNLALDPTQKVKQLEELRASIAAKRDEYVKNRGVKPGYSPTPGAAPTAPQSKAAIRDNIRKANAWIRDNPGDPEVMDARKNVAKWHIDLAAP
jgi:hypothetical protein